jgi:Ca2+-binding RTX toxin-like protein
MTAVTTYSRTGNSYVDSLLGECKWATNSLTYSFPAAASAYEGAYGGSEMAKGFGAFNGTQQSVTRSALKLYASVCNLTFKEVAETDTQSADLRFARSDATSTAWAYFPAEDESGGDVWVNNSSGDYDSPRKGNYAFLTVVHEIGHALGLEHAHEGTVMPSSRDSMEYTVMSYRSYAGASTTSGYMNETWGYAQSLMLYDIAALQHMYGANYATNSGNTTYTWSPTTGEMFINGVGQGASGGNQIFQTLWDGGGGDTYDLSNYTTGLTIDLQPGGWTKTAAEQRAKLHWDGSKAAAGNIANALLSQGDARSLIENAVGGSGSDMLTGNQVANRLKGGAGRDTLTGLAGDDVLEGGLGADTLIGGAGSDTFDFNFIKETRATTRDTIQDLVQGVDHVDLRTIDASTAASGNQKFSFIAAKSFTGQPGQLIFTDHVLSGDVNGDKVADFQVYIPGRSALTATDLYL